jgi:hypothetical protein
MAYFKKTVRPSSYILSVPFEALTDQQQQAVQTACSGCPQHLAVCARAGSGKTTWAVHACSAIGKAEPDASILFLAFQSDVKKGVEAKVPTWGADVRTCHGCGYGFPCRTSKVSLAQKGYSIATHERWGDGKPFSKIHLDLQTDADHIVKFFKARIGDDKPKKKNDVAMCCRLLSLGKTTLSGLIPVYAPEGLLRVDRDPNSLMEIIDAWGMEFSEYTTPADAVDHVLAAMDWTMKGPANVVISKRKPGKTPRGQKPTFIETPLRAICFDDQLWLPLINGWDLPQYDYVIVDEAQDLSAARQMIVRRSLKPSGRMIAVGDEYQAIFGFAGADTRSLSRLIEEFGCEIKGLTLTQRCDKLIVDEANKVDERIKIEARPNADDGTVDQLDAKQLFEHAKPGDAIISRTNAPLVSLFFQLARNGRRVVMLGRDYGGMLAHRIKYWRSMAQREGITFDGHALLAYNREWYNARIEDLGEGKQALKDRAFDEAHAMKALTDGLDLESSECPQEVINRCFQMFSKDKEGKNLDCITLASTHKFKGDERDRVFLLSETYNPGGLKNEKISEDEAQQETNLLYVAITRARHHLTYITGLDRMRGDMNEGDGLPL